VVIRVPDQGKTLGGYAALDDRLLVLDFQAGNPQAFVEIHQRYGPLARRVCQRFLPNPHDGDEAFQETMIRVYQGLYRFNGRYALQPWVARIAKNVSLDILRGRARRPKNDDWAPLAEELPAPDDEAEQIVERLVQHDMVLAVLSDLPETHRQALMMRELDGRSHREIAQEMEVSTAQAKALIHRAKMSFRKRWLEKVAERGGLMGIGLVPLVWLLHVAGVVRKVGDRLGDRLGHSVQVAQAAVPEAVSSTVATTAAPVVSSGVGERVVAAGMTLLLAGGVTVGAAKIVRGGNEGKAPARVVAEAVVPTPTPDTSRVRATAPPVDDPVQDAGRTGDAGDIRAEPPIGEDPEPSPVVETSTVVETSPSVEPSTSPVADLADPSPEPTVTPPPPAPEWTMSFGSDLLGDTSWLSLVNSNVQGKMDKAVRYSQTVTGSLVGSKRALTRINLEYWGSVQGTTGNAELRLFLDSPAGRYEYRASASVVSVNLAPDGSAVYRFRGSYVLTKAPVAAESMPHDGSIMLTLGFWSNETSDETSLYVSAIELVEAP
jgi:RNA polymerase sigma-70 factor (ECF subfamily)